jgi:sec-independent protein translocase protein TatB
MFDVGFLEILMIGVVALVVIGPERLPDVARTIGRWVGKMQRFVRGVKSDIASELEAGEFKKILGDQREQINELRNMVQSTKREFEQSTTEVLNDAKKSLNSLEETVADTGLTKPAHSPASRPAGASEQSKSVESGGENHLLHNDADGKSGAEKSTEAHSTQGSTSIDTGESDTSMNATVGASVPAENSELSDHVRAGSSSDSLSPARLSESAPPQLGTTSSDPGS